MERGLSGRKQIKGHVLAGLCVIAWGTSFLVSKELMPCVEGKVQVARFNFLLDEEGAPWRTYRGPIYQGGYSDHLPIWVDLSAK